jgi:uncharacterized membrane protein
LDANLIFFSIIALSFYNILLKRSSQKLLLLFWVNVFSYLGFVGIYLFKQVLFQHELHPIHQLIFDYTLEDIPLYIVIAFSFLISMIISEKLLDGYDLSLVIPISQFGTLLAAAGYVVLGDPFQWSLVIGVLIVCSGTFILSLSASGEGTLSHVLAAFRKIPTRLWLLVGVQAVCLMVSAMASYIGTKETVRTDVIMDSLRSLHWGPIAFHNAFYFNLGQQIFSVAIFLSYMLARKTYRVELFGPLQANATYALLVAFAYVAAEYAYFMAFTITSDTTILLALDNLSIPMTLLLSFLFLKEAMDRQKMLGSSLILVGGVVAAL